MVSLLSWGLDGFTDHPLDGGRRGPQKGAAGFIWGVVLATDHHIAGSGVGEGRDEQVVGLGLTGGLGNGNPSPQAAEQAREPKGQVSSVAIVLNSRPEGGTSPPGAGAGSDIGRAPGRLAARGRGPVVAPVPAGRHVRLPRTPGACGRPCFPNVWQPRRGRPGGESPTCDPRNFAFHTSGAVIGSRLPSSVVYWSEPLSVFPLPPPPESF